MRRLSLWDMKRRTRFSVIVLLAATAGWGVVSPPAVMAQQQPPTAAQSAGEAANTIEARMSRLEERIREMQAVIGTLQSFVRDAGAAGPGAAAMPGAQPGGNGAPSELSIRVHALETQISALTNQMKDVLARLDQGGGAPAPGMPAGEPQQWQQGQARPRPEPSQAPQSPGGQPENPPYPGAGEQFASAAPPDPQFGTAGDSGADTGQEPAFPWLQRAPQQPARQPQQAPQQQQTAQVPGLSGLSGAGEGARGIYDASYQSFVRNDFDAAEQGFRNFVETHPDDPLATNAWYWLGRTHFERGQYEPAAKAFLAGYKKNKQSEIAPDSLLHLGLSLMKLGENEAACSTLGAIDKQYPDAPARLRSNTATALEQAGC